MPDSRWRATPGQSALACLALTLCCAALGARLQSRRNAELVRVRFTSQAKRLTDQLVSRVQLYEYGLRGARGVIIASGDATDGRTTFRRYHESRDMAREFPGALGFGFVRRLAPAQLPDFVARVRREGVPAFATKQLTPFTGERAVVELMEPLEHNREALGLDIASEPRRRAAALAAIARGAATITAPITLVQAAGLRSHSFLILLPVYRQGMPVGTPAERDAATYGWTLVALAADHVLRGVDTRADLFTIGIADADSTGRIERFYDPPDGSSSSVSALVSRQRRPMFGREWVFEIRPRPAFLLEQRLLPAVTVFIVGALASLLSAALLYFYLLNDRRRRLTRDARERYATIVTNSSDAIIGESLSGELTAWNPAAERIFGYTAAEVLGRKVEDFLVPPERRQEEQKLLDRIRRGEKLPPFETTRRRKDGVDVHVSIAAAMLTGPDGRIVEVAKIVRDISRLKDAERNLRLLNTTLEQQVSERTTALETARHDLTNVLDALPSMIGYWDKGMVNRFANQAYRRWYGLEHSEMAGRHMPELLGPAVFGELQERIASVLRGEAQSFERRVVNQAMGGLRHWLTHYLPDIVDEQVRGFYVLSHDITALSESQRDLAISEALLERTGRVAGVGGWRLDLRTEVIEWTAETRRIFDVTPDYQPTLDAALAFYTDTSRPIIERAVEDALREGLDWDLELEVITASGRRRWVRAHGEVEYENDEPVRMLGALQDITASRAVSGELERALHAAESASAAKSAFLANTSHEIRTPLNAVVGLVYLLDKTPLDPDQRGLVRKIDVAGKALLMVINDVLDLSKVEAGEMRLDITALDLPRLLQDLHDLMAPVAVGKQLQFDVHLDAALSASLRGDAMRVRQVLTNLIGNAIKFTERGRVDLTVTIVRRGAERVLLRFAVRDTGIGIPHDVVPLLFTPFTQADVSTTRRFGGTGLGLSIVRHLTELMDGTCGVDSTPGVGSEFWAEIPFALGTAALSLTDTPLAAEREAHSAAAMALTVAATRDDTASGDAMRTVAGHRFRADGIAGYEGLPGVRVLVVDDSDINLEVARRMLECEGAVVVTASGGTEALALLTAVAHPFDVILMDVQMPGMDGHEVTRRIRGQLGLHDLPIIALTAGASAADQPRAIDAGMDDFLTKPIDPQQLLQSVRRHVERQRGSALSPRLARRAVDSKVWPRIDGIEYAATADRFAHDVPLFLRMLERLLAEVTGSAFDDVRGDGGHLDRTALGARMHRLRGSAGILGAIRLQQLAGDTEQRCATPLEPPEVVVLLDAIVSAGDELARAARPFLDQQPDGVRSLAAGGDAPLDHDALRRLQDLLMLQDLSAIAVLDQLGAGLADALGTTEFAALRDTVHRLEFGTAAVLLRDGLDARRPARALTPVAPGLRGGPRPRRSAMHRR